MAAMMTMHRHRSYDYSYYCRWLREDLFSMQAQLDKINEFIRFHKLPKYLRHKLYS